MFDLRVLFAVFISLLGIALTISQGILEASDISVDNVGGVIKGLKDFTFNIIRGESPPGEIPVKIILKPKDLNMKFSGKIGALEVNARVDLNLNGIDIKHSQTTVVIHDLVGNVGLSSDVEIKKGSNTKDITIGETHMNASNINIRGELESTSLGLKEIPLSTFTMDIESGTVSPEGGAVLHLTSGPVEIVGFKGDLSYDYTENELLLEGKITRLLVAGEPAKIVIEK